MPFKFYLITVILSLILLSSPVCGIEAGSNAMSPQEQDKSIIDKTIGEIVSGVETLANFERKAAGMLLQPNTVDSGELRKEGSNLFQQALENIDESQLRQVFKALRKQLIVEKLPITRITDDIVRYFKPAFRDKSKHKSKEHQQFSLAAGMESQFSDIISTLQYKLFKGMNHAIETELISSLRSMESFANFVTRSVGALYAEVAGKKADKTPAAAGSKNQPLNATGNQTNTSTAAQQAPPDFERQTVPYHDTDPPKQQMNAGNVGPPGTTDTESPLGNFENPGRYVDPQASQERGNRPIAHGIQGDSPETVPKPTNKASGVVDERPRKQMSLRKKQQSKPNKEESAAPSMSESSYLPPLSQLVEERKIDIKETPKEAEQSSNNS